VDSRHFGEVRAAGDVSAVGEGFVPVHYNGRWVAENARREQDLA
jgi:hypothetical protein